VQEIPDGVPFDKDGKPLAQLTTEGLQIIGKAHRERRGDIVVEPFSPLEVRGQWGPLPWHEQRIHMTRTYMTPADIYERWGVECEPDITDLPAGSAGFLERLLFGTGFYGAAARPLQSEISGGATSATQGDGYTLVQSLWLAPNKIVEGMEETPDLPGEPGTPGGRLLVTTKSKVLTDGPRPARFKWTSPIRCYEFIRLPGRVWGSTPLEVLKSPQKAYNQGWKQILENRSLAANPQQVYDLDSGLRADQIDNRPGRQYGVRRRKQGVPPIEWIVPPDMGASVWRSQAMIQQELSFLGSQQGMDAAQRLSPRSSAKMIQELRFEDDRFLGPTMRLCSEESGRMVEDWRSYFKVIYSTKTILRFTGEDNAARTLLLLPEVLQEGDCTVIPDTESMLPEGRGERRSRVYQMWKDGAFGPAQSPAALRMLHDIGRFPGMNLTAIPGGVHRAQARQENMMMLDGKEPLIHEWQDMEVHLDAHETFMATAEWERLADEIKGIFIQHRTDTMLAMVMKQRHMAALAQMAQMPPAMPAAPALPPGGGGGAPAPGPGARRQLAPLPPMPPAEAAA